MAITEILRAPVGTHESFISRKGEFISGKQSTLIPGSFIVRDKSNGRFVLSVHRSVVSKNVSDGLFEEAHGAQYKCFTRNAAAGNLVDEEIPEGCKRASSYSYFKNQHSRFTNGRPVRSGVIGYIYGSLTAWSRKNPEKMAKLVPLLIKLSSVYRSVAPKQYKEQKQVALQKKHVLGSSVFSTLTINSNFRTALHTDNRNDDGGHGIMVVLGDNTFQGGELIFPRYSIAVDLRVGDLIVFDSHEWHCNARIKNRDKTTKELPPRKKRWTLVAYLNRTTDHNSRFAYRKRGQSR
jgi:hypothetical protein